MVEVCAFLDVVCDELNDYAWNVGVCNSFLIKCVYVRTWGAIWLNPLAPVLFTVCSAVTVEGYFPASLVAPLPSSEQTNLPSSNHTYTKSTPKHIHHHYAPSVTSTHTTHIISSIAPTYAPHCRPWICGQTPPE